jgi:hypothetical protein
MIAQCQKRDARAGRAGLALAGALLVLWAASATAASFQPAVVVTDDNVGEPGIDVATSGTLYINAPSALLSDLPGSPSFVYSSTDGGATWTKVPGGLRDLFLGGGDSDIAIDPATGKLYLTDLWLGSSTVSFSSDQGQTWLANPLQGVVVQDRQWIATTGGNVAYHLTHQIPLGLIVSKSIDGGLTYPISTVAATPLDQTGCLCPPGTLIAEKGTGLLNLGDKVGFVYATSTGGIKFARSTNGALTFTNVEVSPASGADNTKAFPIVADGGSGRLAAVWMEVEGGRSRVRFASSSNWGQTWSAPRTLISAGTAVYPWVAAKGSKVAVSVYHTADEADPDTVPESAQWFEKYLASTDGGATFSALQTVDPTPVKSGPICTAGTGCSGDRELLDFQAVTLDAAGRALLTWTRSLDGVADTEVRFTREQ